MLHLRKPVLPALLGGLERDGLPFRLLLRRALGIEVHDGAGGEERENFGRADLDRFLHNQVHVFPFRDGLGEGDAGAERRGDGFMQKAQPDGAGIERDDLGGAFATLAIENGHASPGLEAKNVARMMRLGPGEGGGSPVVRREMEAMHQSGRRMNQESRKAGKERGIWKPGNLEGRLRFRCSEPPLSPFSNSHCPDVPIACLASRLIFAC